MSSGRNGTLSQDEDRVRGDQVTEELWCRHCRVSACLKGRQFDGAFQFLPLCFLFDPAVFALDFAMIACLAAGVFRQMNEIMIIWWSIHGYDRSRSETRADTPRRLGKNWCDVFAKLGGIRTGFVGLGLSLFLAVIESNQKSHAEYHSWSKLTVYRSGFPSI